MAGGRAAALLAHVNLLLTVYGGAGAALAARLKWDPSAYVPLREVLPAEFRAVAAGVAALSAALLLLPHLGAAALRARPPARRPLLLAYAALAAALAGCEAALVCWATTRALAWRRSADARRLLRSLEEARRHVEALLEFAEEWLMPRKVRLLIEEARADLPQNVRVAAGALLLLALLQPLAVLLALLAARDSPAATPPRRREEHAVGGEERSPLKGARDGRRLAVVSPP